MNDATTHIMIGTPAYGGLVHTSFVQAILDYQSAGISYTLVTISNESLITRARNALAATFFQHKQFSHLLFLDADVSLTAAALGRLIAHGKDVVGAPVPLKGRDANGARIFNIGRAIGEDGPLLICQRVGTAALLLSRRAVDALVGDAKATGRVYERKAALLGARGPAIHYDIFQVGVVDGEYLSEDYWICMTLRRLGFSIHVDPEIETQHFGTLSI
jgi:hypothetical protein